MLLPFRAVAAFCLFASATSTAANSNKDRTVRNVAIIGAGAAGSSAAYHLQKFATEEQVAINVTIFEKSDRIGGRTLTVNAYDHPSMPVELGASIFVGVNHILTGAVEEFKLPLANISDQKPGDITAIWDGQNVVFQSENGASWWYDAVRMWWRYGTSPYRAVSLMKNVVNIFLKIYEPPYFPFRSLTQRVYELGLERATGVTGQQFLADNKINPNFCRDIIQAATRVNYASNLPHIHGLETMVSFATDGAVSVAGGNWQIFDRMVAASGATVLKSTAVDSITLEKRRPASGRYKYHLKTGNNSEPLGAFDDVIIATPWQFSDISAGAGVIKHSMEKIPYTKLHVTLFTSPFELQPGFFGLAPGSKAPHNVYTTLGANEMSHPGAEGVGRAGFYSVSTLRTVTNPNTQRTEYLYKIFSAEAVTPAFLEKLLGAEVPAEFVAADADVNHVPTISWYYPHWFNSYPIELPRVTFQDIMVNDGIYYTSGIESFISTMETSALMGKNVARLVVNDIAGLPQQEHVRGSERFPTRGRAGSRRPTVREDFFDSLESELEGLMLGPDEL